VRLHSLVPIAAVAALCCAAPASAQVAAPRPAGRLSFFVNAAQLHTDTGNFNSGELVTTFTYGLPERAGNGVEYGVDMRHSQPTSSSRDSRFSVYDSYVGARFKGGAMRVRAGQMWLTDLGALGAVAGGLFEYRKSSASSRNQLRIGGFGGIEPDMYQAGYVEGVRKYGGYAVLEGAAGRRHVAGFIRVDHGGLAERSVISATNFVPVKSKVFLYQVLEYDLTGPAGQGSGGLSYFFINARAAVASRVELQGLFNRGRSVDARTITDDLLSGRVVNPTALDGLRYQSAGARVTVTVVQGVRAYVGYTHDRNNRDSDPTMRLTLGASAQNVARSGVDVTVSDSQIRRPTGSYQSLYLSAGRQLGRSVYLSGDYSSAVSIVRFTRMDGLTIETRPETRQFGGSANITLGRHASVFANLMRTTDDTTSEMRVLAGLTYRLR
jgi:hypothetical protein